MHRKYFGNVSFAADTVKLDPGTSTVLVHFILRCGGGGGVMNCGQNKHTEAQ